MEKFVKNEKYMELLLKNSDMARLKKFNTPEWTQLQKELTEFEVSMSAADIIRHAEICFPHVQQI